MREVNERESIYPLNVLVLGSGAREHAIADSISKSPLLNKLYLAQTGVFKLGEVIEFSDYEDLAKKSLSAGINLIIIGSEEPLCNGIVDVFKKYNIPCIGVNKYFSQLESSKVFGKIFSENNGIKTSRYEILDGREKEDVLENSHLKLLNNFPIVIKADGLCKGKGVSVAYDRLIAEKIINEYLNGKFGESSKVILLEEFLYGEELSLMSLWDGAHLLHLPPARDFKKLNNEQDAPNTGGMGAFCPVELSKDQQDKLEIFKQKLQNALQTEKADFTGFIYSGLIWANDDWYVLEYNVRLGDPECQAILTHLETDFLEILCAAINKSLDKIELKCKDDYSACLVVASEGYPESPKIGDKISMPEISANIKIFNAGVKYFNENLYSNGGRVLSICTNSKNPFSVLKNFAQKIEMKNKYFREDIDMN